MRNILAPLIMAACFGATAVALAGDGDSALPIVTCEAGQVEFGPFVEKEAAKGWHFQRLTAAEYALFLPRYNAKEPISDDHPDQIWIAMTAINGEPLFIYNLVNHGCIYTYGRIPADILAQYLDDSPPE